MLKLKPLILIIIVAAVAFSVSGCTKVKSNKKDVSGINGGVFVTVDKGVTWKQKAAVPTASGKPASLSGTNVAALVMDPNDRKAVYYSTVGSGLFYTYDQGNTWRKANGLAKGIVRAIAIDPGNKCVIYSAISNKLYKSNDCSRSWSQVYFDNDVMATVDSVAVDHYDSSIVYIGISRGDFIKSLDAGASWQTIHRFKDKITKIVIDPNDSRTIYAITSKKGIFRSVDTGQEWSDFNEAFKELKLGLKIKDFILIKEEPDLMFIATQFGLLRSSDKGETWEKIELILPDKKAGINAAAVNPKNVKEIYYATNKVFYSSIDSGKNWTPTKLPTARAGWKLLIDPKEPNIIYMGVRSLKK